MSHGYTTRDGWFVDPHGRPTLLRGVNLGGSTKVPFSPPSATHLGVDFEGWRDVSFVGRPAPLDEIDRHLDRIVHWGFDVLRFLVTWEAIEHRGPGEYHEEYLDYVRKVVRRAGERGLLVFVDPHQDVWSRWTGGDGAPFWAFEWAGLRAERFVEAEAVALDAFDWPANYDRAPVASMWTLFYAGDTFCPELTGVQTRLQDHYIAAVGAVAERLADLPCVLGYDTLNEPNPGYIGRGDDLHRARRFMLRDGPKPFSPLEHLAAADGVTIERDDGAVLNPKGTSIWARGCPWRRAGVWDVDASGAPVLADPAYFTARAGRPVDGWADFMVPFVQRMRDALRRAHPDCFLFIEGSPMSFASEWADPDLLVCNARHWYDVMTLATRRFDPAAYRTLGGETLAGAEAIGAEFTAQLSGLQAFSRERMGNPPMLIGEFGIPYEMNGGAAYRSGDYSAEEIALDANYRALEATLLNSTHWNYTADNTHEHGDQWNAEDLSIFSPDDVSDAASLDAGGRAVRAFCRPYVRHASGMPTRMTFNLATITFELEIERDPSISAPTVVYVPGLHYGDAPAIGVSAGTTAHDPVTQLLTWHTDAVPGPITLRLSPR